MEWARRIKFSKINRLYRSIGLGLFDDDALQDVGSQLYARCAAIVAVADAHRHGTIPCPQCSTKVQRQINAQYGLEGHGNYNHWFACPHCTKRLLWADCRTALRKTPRCFSCYAPLEGGTLEKGNRLHCACGKTWEAQAYRRSVSTRILLPCPECNRVIRKPAGAAGQNTPPAQSQPVAHKLQCPKCPATAHHLGGFIQCTTCGYKRRWRDYRKGLKRRDETLVCPACEHSFKWQTWRKNASTLVTGNPQPARDFIAQWRTCRTPQARMLAIDFLLQTLHGRGPLAPLFIEGDETSIRRLLDTLAAK